MLAILIAYEGLLFVGLGFGALSILFLHAPLYTCFGDEEEETEEEESN